MRKFGEGDLGQIGSMEWRVVRGRKGPDDLALELRTTDGEWCRVKMGVGALIADFMYENEEHLYPQPRYKGGDYHREFLSRAPQVGWDVATARLEDEKRLKRNRESADC